jgi:uncharacterized protein
MQTIAITGASGFIGRALTQHLSEQGMQVRPLVRPGKEVGDGIRWDPKAGTLDVDALAESEVLVHLAGESIAAGRWTAEKKDELKQSRLRGTSLLAHKLASMKKRPALWVSASAVGYYGDRGDELLDETSGPGRDFLAELAQLWEQATAPASEAGIRVVHARFGIVLDPSGGALSKMLLPFKLGVGGKIGNGRQYMSWIAREDAVRALHHLMTHAELSGPVNLTAPTPVTNAEFTRAFAQALHRPAIMPLPAFAARVAFGEMADAALLSGACVLPKRLLASGFQFAHPELSAFLSQALR